MRIRRSILALVVLLAVAPAWAKAVRIARHPDLHDGKLVFSYLGDLWTAAEDGSNPKRLTVHTARDVYPRYSPDGKWIAFSSDRYGNYDVFVIPADGGEPRQLTFHSAQDTVVGWSRDSKRVLFSSARGAMYPGIANLYEVAVDGGLEQILPTDWGAWGSYSPDGTKLALNRHPMVWWRKHYRGSFSADLWVMDVSKKTFRKLLDSEVPENRRANNFWPLYGKGEIFFVSDRDVDAAPGSREVLRSTSNLWKIPENGGKPVQVTHHKSGSLFFPSISSDGKAIVYEEGFGIWRLDTATGKSAEIKLDIASDDKENNFEVLSLKDELDGFDLSPSTKRAAVSVHGEIFTIATDRGTASRVTKSGSRETSPSWSPDGKWIAYVSDQSGRDEVWVAETSGASPKKLSDADSEKLTLAWAPDSKSLAYTASDHKLHVVEVATGKTLDVAKSETVSLQNPEFSPDGKWISYTKVDRDMRPHVHVVPAAGGDEKKIDDEDLFSTTGAHWTPDGKKLVFLGGYVQGGSAAIRQNVASLYSVSLGKEEKDSMSRDIDDEDAAEAAAKTSEERGPRGERDKEKKAPPEVKIEWEGLARRIRQVTRLSDNITTAAVAPDSKSYAFVAQTEADGRNVTVLYAIQENGDQMKRLTQSEPPDPEAEGAPGGGPGGGIGSLQYSKDGKTLFFSEGRGLWSVGTGGGAEGGGAQASGGRGGDGGGRKRVGFSVRVEVDHKVERGQVFEEAWRIMKNRFYDREMHGVDWPKMREIYAPLLENVGDREELQNVVSMMIGELNASHTGISGGGDPDRDAVRTRFPGFELAADPSGYYKVAYVYRRGPADKDFVKVKVGDFLLAVDGVPVKAGDNYWRYYSMAPGRKMELTFNDKPETSGAWKTRIDPVSAGAYATLQYEKWVEERRQMVEKLSGGEIGYLHIRQMNAQALRKFERDFADNHFKKALIVDQRFNPGGGIDEELLEILQQKQYQYTRNRDSVYMTRPQRGFFGPVVVMQNERSTSDAEVFPDGFRTLKLGKTVGVATYGAVIGTGSYRLMDGSQIRTPGSGLWSVSGMNLENYGVPPDVDVDNTPDDFLAGRDAQIEKAVEVLKEELKKGGGAKVPGRE
jgi:tricorn protease